MTIIIIVYIVLRVLTMLKFSFYSGTNGCCPCEQFSGDRRQSCTSVAANRRVFLRMLDARYNYRATLLSIDDSRDENLESGLPIRAGTTAALCDRYRREVKCHDKHYHYTPR
jgi:hypothetical protein